MNAIAGNCLDKNELKEERDKLEFMLDEFFYGGNVFGDFSQKESTASASIDFGINGGITCCVSLKDKERPAMKIDIDKKISRRRFEEVAKFAEEYCCENGYMGVIVCDHSGYSNVRV